MMIKSRFWANKNGLQASLVSELEREEDRTSYFCRDMPSPPYTCIIPLVRPVAAFLRAWLSLPNEIESISKHQKVKASKNIWNIEKLLRHDTNFPDGLGVRIPDSHSGGPGSIPGRGVLFHLLHQTPRKKRATRPGTVRRMWLLAPPDEREKSDLLDVESNCQLASIFRSWRVHFTYETK